MSVKLSDIAAKANVSLSTASWVLNGRADEFRISEATRKRVLAVSRELDYRPSFSAKALAKGRTYTIGFQCGNLESPYFCEMATLAMQHAERRGYHLTLQLTLWKTFANDLECLEALLRRGVEGVIFSGAALNADSPLHDYLVQKRFPIVQMNFQPNDLPWVSSDYQPGMDQAIEHFVKTGHTKIGFVKSKGTIGYIDPKEQAIELACQRHGLELRTCISSIEHDEPLRVGKTVAADPDRPTAFVVQSDQAAMGFIRGLREGGLDVPRDMSVISIDDTHLCKYLQPQLSSIAHDKEGIMAHAVNTVIAMIEDKKALPESRLFPTTLVLRESTR